MKFTDETFYQKMYDTIADVEKQTSVEVVSMVYSDSDNYAVYVFSLSSVVAIVISLYLMFSPKEFDPWAIYFLSLGSFALLFSLFFFIPSLKRLIIPKKRLETKPLIIAHSIFSQAEMCNTRDRTGLLIYLSRLEQKIILVADKGIKQAVPKDELKALEQQFNAVFKDKSPADAFLSVLTSSADLFAKYLPVKPDDINELPDNLFYKIKL